MLKVVSMIPFAQASLLDLPDKGTHCGSRLLDALFNSQPF